MDFKTDEIVSILKKQLTEHNADIDISEVGEITYIGDGVARVSGLENVISPAGAAGFWQILKETAKEYDLEVNASIDERYHLEKSTQAACDYLNKAFDKFGSWTMAAASYNMGQNGAIRSVNKQGTDNYYNLHLNSETSRYIFRIIAVKEIIEQIKKEEAEQKITKKPMIDKDVKTKKFDDNHFKRNEDKK